MPTSLVCRSWFVATVAESTQQLGEETHSRSTWSTNRLMAAVCRSAPCWTNECFMGGTQSLRVSHRFAFGFGKNNKRSAMSRLWRIIVLLLLNQQRPPLIIYIQCGRRVGEGRWASSSAQNMWRGDRWCGESSSVQLDVQNIIRCVDFRLSAYGLGKAIAVRLLWRCPALRRFCFHHHPSPWLHAFMIRTEFIFSIAFCRVPYTGKLIGKKCDCARFFDNNVSQWLRQPNQLRTSLMTEQI